MSDMVSNLIARDEPLISEYRTWSQSHFGKVNKVIHIFLLRVLYFNFDQMNRLVVVVGISVDTYIIIEFIVIIILNSDLKMPIVKWHSSLSV